MELLPLSPEQQAKMVRTRVGDEARAEALAQVATNPKVQLLDVQIEHECNMGRYSQRWNGDLGQGPWRGIIPVFSYGKGRALEALRAWALLQLDAHNVLLEHVDGACVRHRRALVDSGTLGAKGNVQVVVPGSSESYGASADPPDDAVPLCTLKHFPHKTEHTVQWGRELFDELFVARPDVARRVAADVAVAVDKAAAAPCREDAEDELLSSQRPVSYTHLTLPTNREV